MKHRWLKYFELAGRAIPVLLVILFLSNAPARAALDTSNPITFFTTVADRLLRENTEAWLQESTSGYTNRFGVNHSFGIDGIPVYVPFRYTNGAGVLATNDVSRYTPAVHRLLQVTANLYEATTNRSDLTSYPYLPHVYRPIFRRTPNDEIYIVGYREVRDAQMAGIGGTAPIMVDLNNAAECMTIPLIGAPYNPNSSVETDEPTVYGIPLVIGAKKGFPNFNKFGMQNDIQVSRKLEFWKGPSGQLVMTNQIYELSVSNAFGVQAWNSYQQTFPRPLQAIVAADATMWITNEFSLNSIPTTPGNRATNYYTATAVPLVYTQWPGFSQPYAVPVSFKVPLFTNNLFLTNSFYVQDGTVSGTKFMASTSPQWDPPNVFRNPRIWLNLRTRLRFILVDTTVNRIVDYVNLDSPEEPLDIMKALIDNADCASQGADVRGKFWCTNRYDDPNGVQPETPARLGIQTFGIHNQISVSLGSMQAPAAFWKDYPLANDRNFAITNFYNWFYLTNTPSVKNAPFRPIRQLYQYVSWQANDPLVHYTVPDLTDLLVVNKKYELDQSKDSSTNNMFGPNRMNRNYLPWPAMESDGENYSTDPQTVLETTVKDPLVTRSDNWNFPAGEPLSFANLGRIHRGTPWQTIYLKASDIDPFTWTKWSGNSSVSDAMAMRPVNDRHLVNLFDSLVNTNDPRHRLSVNTTDTNIWLAALDGLVVLSNSLPEQQITISPNSPEAAIVVAGVLRTRSGEPQQSFRTLGAILGTPELSIGSPWLYTNALLDFFFLETPLTDAQYERLPSQLLPWLRADSVGEITRSGGGCEIQFSGYDGFPYAVEVSSDLQNWQTTGTNSPVDGVFEFAIPASPQSEQFYRSRLLP